MSFGNRYLHGNIANHTIMQRNLVRVFVSLALWLAAAPVAADAEGGGAGAEFVFGRTRIVRTGEHSGALFVFGGMVVIEPGAMVNGDLLTMGSLLEIGGTITGDLTVVGGGGALSDSAVIDGDFNSVGSTVQRAPGAVIRGADDGPMRLDRPGRWTWSDEWRIVGWWSGLVGALALAALTGIAQLFLPVQLERVGQELLDHAPRSFFLGAAVLVGVPMAAALLIVTCLLAIAGVAGVVLMLLGLLAGWLALGAALGRRMLALQLQRGLHPALAAAAGCLVLTLTFVAGGTVPVLGGLFTLLGICAVLAGLGAAIATRFGTRRARQVAAALPDA